MLWKHPWTAMICGPTGCGKTHFIKKFISNINTMADTVFKRKILYYAEWQDGYLSLGKDIEFREGLPQPDDFSTEKRPQLVIIDDLMRESSNNTIVDLFTKGSHHKNISVMFITQNLFHQGHGQRDISLNSNYIVIFKNPRDRSQINHIARQIFPENSKFLQEAYYDATKQPHGYLLLDLKQDTPENCRVRSCIFTDDAVNYVYIPKAISRNTHGKNTSVVEL